MKYYLSSYRFGDRIEDLKRLQGSNKKIGHINNARDCASVDAKIALDRQNDEMEILNSLGFVSEVLDLQAYFNKAAALEEKLNSLGAVWVSGGNTFVLRQAMQLSGFDTIFTTLQAKQDFLYGGYSAGICILSESLQPIEQVDDPNSFPYKHISAAIYTGLGVFNYSFMPHYNSGHNESDAIDLEIKRCIQNKWLFKALKDGEVIVIE